MTIDANARTASAQRRQKLVVAAGVVSAVVLIVISIAALTKAGRRQLMQPQENTIEARVTIRRPVEKVFGFYRDFENLPSFLGDVMTVEQIGPATSRWTIQGPLGIQTHWTIRVTEERTNELIRYETVTLTWTENLLGNPFRSGLRRG